MTPTACLDLLGWWFPVACWAVVLAALKALVRAGLSRIGGRFAPPVWLPLVAAGIAFIPVGGLPIGRWLLGLNLGFSLPFLALMANLWVSPLLGRPLLDAPAVRAAVWFGAVAGTVLYPCAVGLGSFDPYVLGWRSPGIGTLAGGLGAVLVLRRNAFGAVLLASGLLWQSGLLESDNAWDALVDPVYWLLSMANLTIGGMASLLKPPRLAAAVAAAVAVSLCGSAPKQPPPSAEQLDEQWAASAAGLERRAMAVGNDELTTLVRGWQMPPEDGRQIAVRIPSSLERPDSIDSPEEEAIWSDFVAARQSRAEAFFQLALNAAQAHVRMPTRAERAAPDAVPRPKLDQQGCEAIRLLYRALRENPDHERAREAGGWVRRQGRWVWPEAARRLDKGDEFSPRFGWLPRGRLARYEQGERYERGRWVKADDGHPAEKPSALAEGTHFASDHWQITSTADPAETAILAASLEEAHDIWLQVFGSFALEPVDMERRFEGRGRTAVRDPFAAVLFADRGQYVAELESLEPRIGGTLGIYWTPRRTAYFLTAAAAGPADASLATVHHEATHQLFAETRKTSPLAGERCGFWAIEAVACYMESLAPTAHGWTLGGRDAGRAAAGRERLVEDGFYVSLSELCSLGRREFQADERLPQIYSQIAGMADFFMNGEGGRRREAFVEYLTRIYTGTVDPDTLARLCGVSYANLDDAYRRHMAR